MWRSSQKLILAFSILVTSKVFAGPNKGELRIQEIKAQGTGCPAQTFTASIAPDGQTFTVLLDNYIAQTSIEQRRSFRNCSLKIKFELPLGWSMALLSADYRGYAYAELGTTLRHQVNYSFNGSLRRKDLPGKQAEGNFNMKIQEFSGPFNDNYYIHHETDSASALWSPCTKERKQELFLNTFLTAVNSRDGANLQSMITLDSIDGQAQVQSYKIAWKKCAEPAGNIQI